MSTDPINDGALERLLRIDPLDTCAANRFLLRCMRQLLQTYPDPADLSVADATGLDADLRATLLSWLTEQNILTGPPEQSLLTLLGRTTLDGTRKQDPAFAAYLRDETLPPGPNSSSSLMVSIMRHHFQRWFDTSQR